MINNYYAEFETDKLIREEYFPQLQYGTMIEVGAAHPTFISMSKHFRENRWRCICIEPNPRFVELHMQDGSEVYQIACASVDDDNIAFKIANNGGGDKNPYNEMSGSALDILPFQYPYVESVTQITVKVKTLNTLLRELDINNINFLSIDVEGWELDVMDGFDADKYQPEIILLENYLHDNMYNEYMERIGYKLDEKIQYNYIYKKIIL